VGWGLNLLFDFIVPTPFVPGGLTWLGYVVMAGAVGLWIWQIHTLKKNKTTIAFMGKPRTLVTDGPYAYSRHPGYLAQVGLLAGLAIALNSWISLLVAGFMWFVLERYVTRYEEKMLLKTLGDDYRQYRKRVRKWV
jgi:protein-S-isoprenylcysteine O-methyltransferase Ste14